MRGANPITMAPSELTEFVLVAALSLQQNNLHSDDLDESVIALRVFSLLISVVGPGKIRSDGFATVLPPSP
jgi:hypothetical protein